VRQPPRDLARPQPPAEAGEEERPGTRAVVGTYGNVARDLDESWGGQYGAELKNPDFMKLADAYGVVGMRAKEPTEVGRLVREAIDLDRPALVEVPVGRMNRPMFFAPRRTPAKHPR